MKWKTAVLSFTGLCAASSLTLPCFAFTKSRLFPATLCECHDSDRMVARTSGRLENDAGLRPGMLLCPVTTDSTFEPSFLSSGGASTVTISVDGYNRAGGDAGTDGILASACRVWVNGGGAGGTCGAPAKGGTAGAVVHLAPSASAAWTNNSDAKFILVQLEEGVPRIPSAPSAVWSYKITYTQ